MEETEPMITDVPFYRLYTREKFYILQMIGRLPEEVPVTFIDLISKWVLQPKNILVNCLCLQDLPPSWKLFLQGLSYILSCTNKKLGFIYDDGTPMAGTPLRSYPGLMDFFKDWWPQDRPIIFHFLKAFVFSTHRTLLVQAMTPSLRKTMFTRKEHRGELLGDVNGIIPVMSANYFYVVSLSFPQETFLKMISLMLGEKYTQVNEDIMDGAAELIAIILGQTQKIVNLGENQIRALQPKTILGKAVPQETLPFQEKDWTPFRSGFSVVIHFNSPSGDFYVEIWFPKEFQVEILATLKGPKEDVPSPPSSPSTP